MHGSISAPAPLFPACPTCPVKCLPRLPNLSNGIFVAFIPSGWNLFIPFHRGEISVALISLGRLLRNSAPI